MDSEAVKLLIGAIDKIGVGGVIACLLIRLVVTRLDKILLVLADMRQNDERRHKE